jgi:hypothetical protein
MSRIVIIVLIYYRHKTVDIINMLSVRNFMKIHYWMKIIKEMKHIYCTYNRSRVS